MCEIEVRIQEHQVRPVLRLVHRYTNLGEDIPIPFLDCCDNGELASCTRASRNWHEGAVRILWRDLNTIVPLLVRGSTVGGRNQRSPASACEPHHLVFSQFLFPLKLIPLEPTSGTGCQVGPPKFLREVRPEPLLRRTRTPPR